jgi:hypothetical protein
VTGQVIDFDRRDLDKLGHAHALTREVGWCSSVATISILA